MPHPIVSEASTVWNGNLFTGSGSTSLQSSGVGTFDVTWKARSEEHGGLTSPEELIAAALASCYPMQLSLELEQNGTTPTTLNASVAVTFVAGQGITAIAITVEGDVPDISDDDFQRIALSAKGNCPVSKALAVDSTLSATLV